LFDPKKNEFTIEDRSQLIYALTEAVTLEHLLMCQYLFAGASLKTHVAELTNKDRRYFQIERIRYWKRKLFEIAREEMQHLALAMNLLVSVGGAPTFARPNFPAENQFYKTRLADGTYAALEMTLEKFSGPKEEPLRTINRFIRFERPKDIPPEPAVLLAVPAANLYDTVGELYSAIRRAFDDLPGSVIDVDDQYDPSDEDAQRIRLPNRPPIQNIAKNPTEAKTIIDQIVFQGEGYPDRQKDPRAHYRIFLELRRQFADELALDPDFDPSRPVVSNPLTRVHEDTPVGRATILDESIDGGLQFGLLQLFAGAYEVLLGFLGQLFGPMPSASVKSPAFRAIETLTFLPFMTEVMAPLAEVLTQIPAKVGKREVLGAGFEVTSNDFLIPSINIATRLADERINILSREAFRLSNQLSALAIDDPAKQLEFIGKTLSILNDELKSRSVHGWPPSSDVWDDTFSEAAPDKFNYSFKEHVALELCFEGVAQIRLATDPDGAAVKRGITGNGFAIGDEPDLDRVIRFDPKAAVQRSHCPPIGVRVYSARIVRQSLMPWDERGIQVPFLKGAQVNLADSPVFEGRNHVVAEDGEPIDPFSIAIQGPGGFTLRRRTIGIPINDMTPLQRRGTGRYPVGGGKSDAAMQKNLSIMSRIDPHFSFDSPADYVQSRIQDLENDYSALRGSAAEYGPEGAKLEFRLRSLKEGLRDARELDARPIRWTRYFFYVSYRHFVSGEITGDLGSMSTRFALPKEASSFEVLKWFVQYDFGFFDTDAMSACVSGKLYIPLMVVGG
jgi:hypothetical protein